MTFEQSVFNKVCNRGLLFMNMCRSQSAQALKVKACIRGEMHLSTHFWVLLFSGCAWSCSVRKSINLLSTAAARMTPLFER